MAENKQLAIRIGQGFDAHRFQDGDEVILGGERIAFNRSLAAHSDGDVLLHAICDGLLGALALGDIGKHFPDTDPAYQGADSRELLRQVIALIRGRGYEVSNIDATIIAEQPKMAPHIAAMTKNIADDCGIDTDTVSVKATTTEKMGFTGRGEGIASSAVVLLSLRG